MAIARPALMKDLRVTARTRMRWRDAAVGGAVGLLVIVAGAAVWYRATYHVFPGMMPTVVHWCGRDYQTGGEPENWARVTAAEKPRQIRAVGAYPPFLGFSRPLLAAPGDLPVSPGEPCAMAVYLRTGPGRYQPYTLEGGP